MNFLSMVFILLMGLALPAQAGDDLPPLDEYDNVRPGVLMPENGSAPPAESKNAPANGEAAEDLTQAMTIGDLVATYNRGDFDLAAKRLLPLANSGQHQAEELLGIMYKSGQGVPKDLEQAMLWLNKAAEANRPLAQHHLGIAYYTGEGVLTDPVRSLMWLHIAIAHYPEGAEKKRAMEDRDNVAAQLTRRDKDRALQLAREWLTKKNEGHLLGAQQ